MKSKYIFGLLAVGTAMSLVSCDDFIDDNRYPLDRQTVNPEFWSNDVNVQNQINYFYEDYSGYGNGNDGYGGYGSYGGNGGSVISPIPAIFALPSVAVCSAKALDTPQNVWK